MRSLPFCVIACFVCLGSSVRSEEPDAKVLVEQIVAATNGQDNVLKLFRIKERLNVSSDPEKKGKERESIVEPPEFWWIGKKERGPEPAKFLVWAWTLGVLTDPRSKVAVLPEVMESDKPAIGLRVSGTIDPAMDLYFDKESYRLIRIDWRSDIHRLSDWQDRDGLKYQAKCIGYKKSSGKPWYFSEILELERLNELPAGLKR